MMAPRIGAAQNSHNWVGAPSPLKTATAVERGGLTGVLLIGIEMRWISVIAKPIAMGAKPMGRPGGRSEDDIEEHGGEDGLGDEDRGQGVAAGGVDPVTIGRHVPDPVEAVLAGGNGKSASRSRPTFYINTANEKATYVSLDFTLADTVNNALGMTTASVDADTISACGAR